MGQSMRIFALRRWQLSLTLGARAEAARQDEQRNALRTPLPGPNLRVVIAGPIGPITPPGLGPGPVAGVPAEG